MFDSLFPKHWTTLQRLMWLKTNALARAVYETVTGNPVSFTAKAAPLRQLSVAFSPVQDLHGYDNPWPAGGGSNIAQNAERADQKGITVSVANDGVITINGTATDTCFIRGRIMLPDLSATYTWATFNNTAFNSGVEFSLREADYSSAGGWSRVNAVNKTYSFTVDAGKTPAWWQIQINTGTVFSNFIIKPMIVRGSTAPSAYLPYSNECPISGWDSLNVEQRGVNVWDEEWEVGGIDSSTGRDGTDPNSWRTVNYIPIKPNTEYYVASSATNKSIRARFYAADKSYIGYAPQSGSTDTGHAFVSPENAYYLRFNPAITGVPNHDISINYPATDHDYHAYNPSSRSISINLGQTIYGGTVDVVTGVVKARPYYASYNGETLVGPWMSSMDKYVAGATPTVGAQVVDMGGAETTIQLTPQEVESLAGDNVMWTDAASLEVTYRSN